MLDSEDAKDVTQETFIRVFQNIGRLRRTESFKGWLMRIAMNCAMSHLKRRACNAELPQELHDVTCCVEKEMVERDMVMHVKEALKRLPERQRMILGLRLFRDMDFSEIAEMMNIKPATARTNFHFGMKNLKSLLESRKLE
jgi:RNA polymerase sigma-70 factor (ECF subfamily)